MKKLIIFSLCNLIGTLILGQIGEKEGLTSDYNLPKLDTTIVYSAVDFHQITGLKTDVEGWLFRGGNDFSWAKKDLNLKGWKRFKPSQLSINSIKPDETGKIEGWARLKFQVDKEIAKKTLFINKIGFEAADIYLDGQKIYSFGQIGTDKKTFRAHIFNPDRPRPIQLIPNKTHTISIHFVDYTVLFGTKLKRDVLADKFTFIEIYDYHRIDNENTFRIAVNILNAILLMLSCFFWFLLFLNPKEKNILYISICTTIVSIAMFLSSMVAFNILSFHLMYIFNWLLPFFVPTALLSIPIIFSLLIKQHIPNYLKWSLLLAIISAVIDTLMNGTFQGLTTLVIYLLSVGLTLYLIIVNRNKIQGAIGFIILGALFAVTFMVLSNLYGFLANFIHVFDFNPLIYLVLYMLGSLLIPLACLGFIVFRFREGLNAERIDNQRVIELQKADNEALKLKLIFQENEQLLHSILPMSIAEQLKKSKDTVVQKFEHVSILFADLVGFTKLSEKLPPKEVVDLLNGLFSQFDDLTDKYGIEKIKTIGDAYMVAAGVPEIIDHPTKVLFSFAQEMLQTLQAFNQSNGRNLALRIGINSGPVVAGVIGKKKFTYDLWGDTVNTAARMEAYGQSGHIQVAPATYEILKKDFKFKKIPNVEIKGKGKMDVFLWLP